MPSITESPQARWRAKKLLDPEYRKEQEGIYPAQTYYNRKKHNPEFKAKRKKYADKQRFNQKWKEYQKKYRQEVYAIRLPTCCVATR